MADADLDALIRQLAKQQTKALTAAMKKQRDRMLARAAKSGDSATKKQQRHLAKDIFDTGAAVVKRLQTSADNAADSYARSVRQAVETAKTGMNRKPAKKANGSTPNTAKKAARKSSAK